MGYGSNVNFICRAFVVLLDLSQVGTTSSQSGIWAVAYPVPLTKSMVVGSLGLDPRTHSPEICPGVHKLLNGVTFPSFCLFILSQILSYFLGILFLLLLVRKLRLYLSCLSVHWAGSVRKWRTKRGWCFSHLLWALADPFPALQTRTRTVFCPIQVSAVLHPGWGKMWFGDFEISLSPNLSFSFESSNSWFIHSVYSLQLHSVGETGWSVVFPSYFIHFVFQTFVDIWHIHL